MPLQQQELLKVCEILAEEEGLRVTVTESFKGACYAFAGALVGGVLGGPIGLGLGTLIMFTISLNYDHLGSRWCSRKCTSGL